MFTNEFINLQVLRERAFNLRWATVNDEVIPLTAADPDFPCAQEITEAITTYASSGYFSYAPAEGLPDFKEALHDFFFLQRNYLIPKEFILPVDSAAFGIQLICQSILSPGDEAIIFDPVDFLFEFCVNQANAKAVRFPIPQGINAVDFTEMEKLISPKTKLICLCNPLNPTGKVFSREELIQLGDIALTYNLLILSDEIWSDIVFKPATFTSIGSLSESIANQTITVSGFSKSYGLAGLRVGVVATNNAAIFQRIFEKSLHQYTVHGANSIGQIAGIAALRNSQTWLANFVQHLQEMRDFVTDRINQINGLSTVAPDGCYVSLIKIDGLPYNAEQMQKHLLDKAKVLVVPGLSRWFGPGAEGHFRISFATSKEILTEALSRIEENL